MSTSDAALPGVAVWVNVTGEPSNPGTDASANCGPAPAPRIRRVAARPASSLVEDAGLTSPTLADQATWIPATGFPNSSVTRATRESGSAVPTGADCPSPLTASIRRASDEPAVAVNRR